MKRSCLPITASMLLAAALILLHITPAEVMPVESHDAITAPADADTIQETYNGWLGLSLQCSSEQTLGSIALGPFRNFTLSIENDFQSQKRGIGLRWQRAWLRLDFHRSSEQMLGSIALGPVRNFTFSLSAPARWSGRGNTTTSFEFRIPIR